MRNYRHIRREKRRCKSDLDVKSYNVNLKIKNQRYIIIISIDSDLDEIDMLKKMQIIQTTAFTKEILIY